MSVNIQDAKVLIRSSKASDRGNGLKQLIRILDLNRGTPGLESLKNKSYQALCDDLFQCMRDERASFLKKPKTAKLSPPFQLSATALRSVVNAGLHVFKVGTAESIIQTIIEVLPGKDGALIAPLLGELPKALRALLEYSPHVERLSKDCWDAAVDFCIESLSRLLADLGADVQTSFSTRASPRDRSRTRTPFDNTDVPTPKSSGRDLPLRQPIPEAFLHPVEDFIHCLHSLTKVANTPILDKAEDILALLVQFLQRKTSRSHATALAIVNAVLSRISLHSVQLTKRTIQELLPLMKSLWADPLLRDEILVTLMVTETHLSSILAEINAEAASFDLEALVETMYGDYRRRQESSVLQFLEDDHICFRHIGRPQSNTHPLNTFAFSMKAGHLRAESLWMLVSTIARLSSMLDRRRRILSQSRDERDELFAKRPRTTNLFHDYLRHTAEPRSNAKRAALHVLAFIFQEGPVEVGDLILTLEKLTGYISDENPVHSSWAMIALTAAAFQKCSSHSSLRPYWVSAWQSASRMVTSSSSSRAACHLMNALLRLEIVPFSAVSETIQSMLTSIELNGPALLTEASANLLSTVIQQKIIESPTQYTYTAERVLNWFLSKWTPSLWQDRTYASMNAHHCEARDVLTLLGACLDRPFVPPSSAPFLVLGPISQAKIQSSRNTYLERYLLLLEDREEYQALPPTIPEVSNSVATKHLTTQLETRLLEFCHSEIEKTIDRWREGARKNSQSFTSDMLRIITSSCIVFSALCGLSDMEHQRVRMLEAKVDNLADTISNSLVKETEQYKVDAVIESFATSLPEIQHLPELDQSYFRRTGVFTLAMHLSRALVGRNEFRQSFLVDDGFMDVDEDRNSQGAGGNSNPHSDVPRHDIQAATDAAALRATCLAYCHLVSSISADSYDRECIPPSFVDYITSIHEAELIRCRPFIKALFSSRLRLPKVSCLQLVERVSEALIHPLAREYNSSEVANTIVLDVLIGVTADLDLAATDKETQDLYQAVQELYSFYIKEIEKIGVRRSVELQKTLADFLHGLLEHNPDFAKGSRAPSVRTSLFELLQQGEVAVKYHIADRLPRIFEYFVLPEHEKILQDIDDSLPSDIHWKEGLAIRLLSLSKLASRWHTLLRQGVYRIFATAGSVDHATEHAKRCIQDVAKTRDLGSSQMLFRLFAPQIIFTWLDRKRKFSEIPYLAFDYASLEALIRDIESEAVGQAIMLGLQSELDYLAQILGTSVPAMLQRNIGKAAAYTISWDTCKGSARNRSDASNAMLLREMVGHEQYATLIQAHFPTVLGYILQTVDQEERVTKPLEKRTAFAGPAKALAEMNKISHSSQKFELGIEPSFNAYYLIDQLERLCRRTGDDPARFWRPQVYTFTMRMLLDRLHPSLGSLHARSIIRKIRILVALAGEVAFTGYALEMALQSLRPFITDMQCAEDTLGIVQYLFDHGMEYLLSNLSFVTGIGLSILISIRVFLGSSQESTTQESQHTATMDKAERFHKWLTQYLEKYADTIPVTKENADLVRAFRLIITAASRIRAEGNSFKGSEESRLLLQILDDVRSNRRLLNNTSREVALDLLCRNFQPAVSAWDDVLGSDAAVAKYAPQVWESCQRSNIGDGYLLWAARVLGRAFSAHGEVRRKVNQSRPWIITDRSAKSSHGRTSREAIIETMLGLFSSNDCKEASLAETTTRLLILRLPSYVYADEVTNRIPKHIAEALNLQVVTESVARTAVSVEELKRNALPAAGKPVSTWIRDLAVSLCHFAPHDPILSSLAKLLLGINAMAPALFPYILHLVLLEEYDGDRRVRQAISEALSIWLSDCDTLTAPYVRILINAILYLRSQPVPKEITRVDRDQWLEVDYLKAARAAGVCGMYRSALLFAETSSGQPIVKQASRRSSLLIKPPSIPLDVQLLIYKNLDEPDSFYGVDRGYSLSTVLDRLDHEADGIKSLLFRGARLDSQIRHSDATQPSDSRGFIKSLIHLNMNNITHTLLSSEQFHDIGDDAIESTLHAARKLGQWDIKAPEGNHSESSTLFKAFQGLHYAPDLSSAKRHLDGQLLTTMKSIAGGDKSSTSIKSYLRTLAALTESDEIINTPRPDQLLDVWDKLKSRESWMRAGEFEDVRLILSCRETLLGVLGSNKSLQESMSVRAGMVRHMEVEALVQSSAISRKHAALQDSLTSVTYLSDIVPQCKTVGLDIEATAQNEVASVLWDQGEAETSIRMRQHLIEHTKFDSQSTDLSLPVLLAKLGHHIADARLAKPDTIIKEYLEPAIKELNGQGQGIVPSQVFHEFALFCDKQLQNPEAAEDIARIKTVMDKKYQEHKDFMMLLEKEKSKSMRDTYKRGAQRAMTWYKLDRAEYERLRQAREQFLRQCLENYLLSLQASDDYNNDALRVFSLWLEYSDMPLANDAVKPYLPQVPSGKFAPLMNQLSSRLQDEPSDFQRLLYDLVYRICVDHPYHGMYQIFAIQTKVSMVTREDQVRSKDESAKSRQRAATNIARKLEENKKSRGYWRVIHQSAELYHALAMYKNETDTRYGRDIPLDKYSQSKAIVDRIPEMSIPPATLQIEVRANCDYSDLPKIKGFKPRMSIANGLSAPKILTAMGTDGKQYKQLFKSGNDDLRQDAIMEQVFDQVSRLLKNHTATRLRNLGIRTYKVLPLSTRSGLMEFVQNTIPLHQWVMPAHEKYYPNDWKPDKCRREMSNCQSDSQSTRVKVWQRIADNFHPVLRYFLLERFEDPDEWFEKRLAYTRSTAAISILGHVLGLGDRHCHNILLDEKSGEVVHIDLGVSFEAGRLLPVPEVVPFRLTRDLVDAMGYTKTEGVFRRCCEFTMDTLREERESIMTLLNVLRYDPLVNWSVTPGKAKRMQEGQDTNANAVRSGTAGPGGTPAPTPGPGVGVSGVLEEGGQDSHKKREEQAGEAGRALSVVEKKLSKTLSTPATVNELIQTATDERNLAVLYCGWASYA